MNDYNSLLSDQEIAILREKKDWKTTMTIISMWAQVLFAFSLFIYLPNALTFIISSVIVAAKQFQMTVLMHDGAHGLMYKNRKLNDFASQWFCAFPVMAVYPNNIPNLGIRLKSTPTIRGVRPERHAAAGDL